MAGDWLKLECSTPDKPETLAITAAMGWTDPDLTVGKLFRVWRWFDQQTVDGNARSVTFALLDHIAGVSGFAKAMLSVGWLVETGDGLSLPHFDRHNGKTAKQRILTARRAANFRINSSSDAASPVSNADRNAASVTNALPREDKEKIYKNKKHTAPASPSPVDMLLSHGVDKQAADDWLKLRKQKKLPLTETALAGVMREAAKANMPLDAVIRLCCERGWAGFNAEWVTAPRPTSTGAAWWTSDAAREAKARELGLSARPGEPTAEFDARIRAAINGSPPARTAPSPAVEIRASEPARVKVPKEVAEQRSAALKAALKGSVAD